MSRIAALLFIVAFCAIAVAGRCQVPPDTVVKMPFQLLNFETRVEPNAAHFSWITEPTFSEGKFIVQRSRDSLLWYTVYLQPVKQGYIAPYFYTCRINAAYQYLRLAYEDVYGRITPVSTRRIDNIACANVKARARLNRRTRKLRLNYSIDLPRQLLLRVYDQNGQQTHTQMIPSGEAADFQVEIDFTDFRRGIYLLVFTQVDLDLDLLDYRIEY